MINSTIPRFKSIRLSDLKNEVLAGLTVAMTMIPESLSFAILAGLSPLTGLYAAFLMGIVTSIFGGRPGMVSGGAGATVVVLMALAHSHGVEYLFGAVILAGILQLLVGVFKLGKFVRLISEPVMYGFLNGLAIIIFMAQIAQFKINENGVETWMQGPTLYLMIGLTIATIIIVFFFPKVTKTIPSSLVAIAVIFTIVYFFNIDTKKVIDIASVSGSLPSFNIPNIPFNLEMLKVIFPYSLVMAGVGLIETLLTINMVDEITHTKGKPNKEVVAQGFANITNGFFGGMGGCAMVAQTLVNLEAGAKTKIAAIIGALTILLVILIGSPVIEQIPMAALVGVMMMVAISTFKWASFRIIKKMPKSDIFVGILVAAITVLLNNLALAVLIGVVISALVFAWDNGKRIEIKKSIDRNNNKVYDVFGPLFFGSTTTFTEKFDAKEDPDLIIIDFKESRVTDMSAIEALKKLVGNYERYGKKVILKNLSEECVRLMDNSDVFVAISSDEDANYKAKLKD